MSRDEEIVVALIVVGVVIAVVYYGTQGDSDDDSSSDGGGGPAPTGLAGLILNALSSFENTPLIHNNPGGICGSFDSNGNCIGPATYGSLSEGIAAGEALVTKYLITNPSITVAQFVSKWSGGSGDALQNYINKVASELGLDPNEPISDAAGDGGDDPNDDYGT